MSSDFNSDENGFKIRFGSLEKFRPRKYKGDLSNLIIPEGVIDIGYQAFVMHEDNDDFPGVEGLTKVTLPSTLTNIYGYAFYGCRDLEEVKITGDVPFIAECAFEECSDLEEMVPFPSHQEIINEFTYTGSGIKSIILPPQIKQVYESAFAVCREATTLVLNEGLEEIDDDAFSDLISLEKPLIIPSSVKVIGSGAFGNDSSVPSIHIKGVCEIQDYAFYEMNSVTLIELPKEIKIPDNLWGLDKDKVTIKRI